jgi:RimJ/RimL family protein N-acetyltransferase
VTRSDSVLLRFPARLSDDSVLLDSYRLTDAEAHLAGEDAEMRRRFDQPRPADLVTARRAIERWIAGRAAGRPMFAYAVRDSAGTLIGGCELRMRSTGAANLSYWIFPAYRRRGFASRALNLVAAAAEGIPGLSRLELRIAPDNLASRRVARKAGFSLVGSETATGPTGTASTVDVFVKDVEGIVRASP